MVLEAEFDARTECEIRKWTAETPNYGSCSSVDFVDGGGVATGDKVGVRGARAVDGVDVVVVKGVRAIVAGSKDK